jgi:hypothetical protein
MALLAARFTLVPPSQQTCRRKMSPPSSVSKNKPSSACFLLHTGFLLSPSTPTVVTTYSSETSVHFQRTTRRYIPQDKTLDNGRYESLRSTHLISIQSYWRLSAGRNMHCNVRIALLCNIHISAYTQSTGKLEAFRSRPRQHVALISATVLVTRWQRWLLVSFSQIRFISRTCSPGSRTSFILQGKFH